MIEAVKEWALVLLIGVVLGVVLWGISTAASLAPPVALCVVVGLLATVAARALAETSVGHPEPQAVSAYWLRPVRPGLLDVSTLETVLLAARDDQERFDTRVRPRVAELTVELLRQSRGLPWPAPDAAARQEVHEVVGERLWTLLTAPPGAVPASPARVREWIEDLEGLVAQG